MSSEQENRACSFEGEGPKVASSITLVTGGARAGKSDFALTLADPFRVRKRLFIATAVSCDAEMQRRIAAHRKVRGNGWATLEEPVHLPDRIPQRFFSSGSMLLFDCLPTFITNLLLAKKSAAQIRSKVRVLLKACGRSRCSAIFVTNEVGFGVVPDHPLGREFRDLLGAVNQEAARAADCVYLLVAGIPLRLK